MSVQFFYDFAICLFYFNRLHSLDLRFSYGFLLPLYGLRWYCTVCWVDFNRLSSMDLRFSYGFPILCNFTMFLVDLNRLPSPNLSFSYGFPMCGFLMV